MSLNKAVLYGAAQAKVMRYAAPLDTALTVLSLNSPTAIGAYSGIRVPASVWSRSRPDAFDRQRIGRWGSLRFEQFCKGRRIRRGLVMALVANDAAEIRPFIKTERSIYDDRSRRTI